MKKKLNNIPKVGERVEFASHFIPVCKNLLDIGCGDGVLQNFINGKVEQIYGIDNDKRSINACLGKYYDVVNLDINSEKIPYKDNFFDCVSCLDVIEHINDPELFLKKIYKVIKPKGYLIITTPNIRFSDHLFKLVIRGYFPKTSMDMSLYDGGHIHFFTFNDLRFLLNRNKFLIIKEEGIINKSKRGIIGQLFEKILGRKFMLEFRSPGILLVAQKI